jgi:hypothetical protein
MMNVMQRNMLAVLASMLLISNMGMAQKVTVDSDESVDFSNYQSFVFLGWQDDSDQVLNDLDRKRFRDSFKAEFASRNLEEVESNGQLAVSLYLVVSQATSTTAYTNYHGGTGYRYRRGGRGWGNGHSSTVYSETDYLKGTLVIDIFDANTKEIVWQAVASGTVKEKPEKREKSIPKTVKKLMKKFPIKLEK